MPHVAGGKFAPVLVERDAFAQGNGPGLAIGTHRPRLRQFGNIGAGMPINPHQVFESGPFIELAAATLQPGEVGVPAQGCHGDFEPIHLGPSGLYTDHGGQTQRHDCAQPYPTHTPSVHGVLRCRQALLLWTKAYGGGYCAPWPEACQCHCSGTMTQRYAWDWRGAGGKPSALVATLIALHRGVANAPV